MLEAFKAGLQPWVADHFICDDNTYCHMNITGVASHRYVIACREVTALMLRLTMKETPNQ